MTRVPEPRELPFLLRLLEDDSPVVRQEVTRALTLMGSDLARELNLLSPPEQQLGRIRQLLEPTLRDLLAREWGFWRACQQEEAKLLRGLSLIAHYQTGHRNPETLDTVLGTLTSSFLARHPEPDAVVLARHLFGELGLRGETEHYYDPLQSNLVDVVLSGSGNPISLSCIYILVGRRLGLEVSGCNYPGHFFARARLGDRTAFIDCYQGGLVMDRLLTEDLRRRASREVRERLLDRPASAQTILVRMLRNLVTAYQRLGERDRANFFLYLLKTTEDGGEEVHQDVRPPLYSPGQLVRHRHHGYRGVIVDYDLKCTADELWYRSSRAQPDRNQPWYRVLVDDTEKVGYVAETSLSPDESSKEVNHPYVVYFFSKFEDGVYFRNSLPWPDN
ncbi:MAG: heat shock protein HspQ [Armatimonadetes bacterium]|nr:heat shock protein HspQ [Armatimonadota bacterium]